MEIVGMCKLMEFVGNLMEIVGVCARHVSIFNYCDSRIRKILAPEDRTLQIRVLQSYKDSCILPAFFTKASSLWVTTF